MLDDLYLPLVSSYVDLSAPEATPENLLKLFRICQLTAELKNLDYEDLVEEKEVYNLTVTACRGEVLCVIYRSSHFQELDKAVRSMRSETHELKRGFEASGWL